MKKADVKKLAVMSLLIAMEVVLSRFLSVTTPIVKISFSFLPIALSGALYGPVYAGIGAAAADILGMLLFPAGAFFPGFTLTAFLTGIVYGVCLHGQSRCLLRTCVAVFVIAIVLNLGLNTLWLRIITGKGYLALLPPRVLKSIVMIPVKILGIRLITSKRFLTRFVQKQLSRV